MNSLHMTTYCYRYYSHVCIDSPRQRARESINNDNRREKYNGKNEFDAVRSPACPVKWVGERIVAIEPYRIWFRGYDAANDASARAAVTFLMENVNTIHSFSFSFIYYKWEKSLM